MGQEALSKPAVQWWLSLNSSSRGSRGSPLHSYFVTLVGGRLATALLLFSGRMSLIRSSSAVSASRSSRVLTGPAREQRARSSARGAARRNALAWFFHLRVE